MRIRLDYFVYIVAVCSAVAKSQSVLGSEESSISCPPKCLCFSTTVRCMFLQLKYIPTIPPSTTVLDLRFNKIRSISKNSFSKLKQLNTLLLNNNHISRLQDGSFDGLENLRYLYLYKNRIRQIEPSVFNNLIRLEQLYLHFNDLVTFDKNTFSKLKSLERLFLHNNRIQSIPRGAFKNLHALKRLRLDSNALVCDCQLMWLAEMVKEKREKTQVAATCEFPSDLQGKSLSSLADTEFHCIGNNKGSPEILEEPSDVEVNFGGTAYFSCKVDGNPQPDVVWLYNNEVISENPRQSVLHDGTLMVEDAQEDDADFYECKVINDVGEAHSGKVKILMPKSEPTKTEQESIKPYWVRVPADTNATVGSAIELECQAEGHPKPEISWTKDNVPLTAAPRIQVSNGDLLITEVRIEDAGLYKCLAVNNLGRITTSVVLHIPAVPRFVVEPRDVFTTEGGTAVFSCEAEGETDPIILWYRNDALINSLERITIFVGGNRLRIQDVKRYDEGEFSCRAKNDAGEVEAKAILYVRDKLAPIIKREPHDTAVAQGDHAEMNCYAQGLPLPSVVWKKDGQTITESGKYKITPEGSLKVHNISAEDEGLYECSASNYVGYAAARATLSVKGAPRIHLGDEFLEESYKEAEKKVNEAFSDTISQLFDRDRAKPPEPHELLRIFRFPQYEGRNIAKIAETIEQTLEIVQRHVESGMKFNLTEFSYEDLLSPTKLRSLSDISGCLGHRRPVTDCEDMCFHLKYRTIDGTCNNLNKPMWGASLIGFRREMSPIYENGFNTPVGWTKTKKYYGYFKPSPRVVSTRLLTTENITPDDHCTHMLMQWGQFLDHDLDHALPSISTESFKTGVPCLKSCEYSSPCFPIEIPTDDPRVRHHCMEFTRSSAVCGSGMSSVFFDKVLPREQINQLTSYIDGSQIYSSSNLELKGLRNLTYSSGELRGGLLGPTGKQLLPFSDGLPIDCRRDHSESSIDCFLGGDIRANEQVGLLAMHTLWFREHNRIARSLRELNPHWDAHTLFHEARKIVGAEIQHITYTHWLPHLLGESGMASLGGFKGYDPTVDAAISNAFATAAFRIGHTIINPKLERLNSTFQAIPEGHLPLHKAFFSPWRIVKEGGIDPILRGLFVAPAKAKKPGQLLNLELTEKLFASAHIIALDLAAINIQRGRDHALPGYLEWRRFCNLSVPETFNQLEADISSKEVRTKLRQLYGHPGNIDLFVGGVLEDKVEGGRVGPTFSCILRQQFRRLRDGDRFWYENPWMFKPEQLAEIQKASLGRIVCDNGDTILDVTKDVFILPQEQSPAFVPCSQISKVDLRMWSECCRDCESGREELNNFDRLSNRLKRRAEYSYIEEKDFYSTGVENVVMNSSEVEDRLLAPESKWRPHAPSDRLFQKQKKSFKGASSKNMKQPVEGGEGTPLEGHSLDAFEDEVTDLTEERIEGVEAIVERLSKTVEHLLKKVRLLERARGLEALTGRQFCLDQNNVVRQRGEEWLEEDCVRCTCKARGVKCTVVSCPETACEFPVKEDGSCCPRCP